MYIYKLFYICILYAILYIYNKYKIHLYTYLFTNRLIQNLITNIKCTKSTINQKQYNNNSLGNIIIQV